MDLKKLLLQERAELDQSWAEVRRLFVADMERMINLWSLLSERKELDAVRGLSDEDLQSVVVLTMLALKELLQQTGMAKMTD